MSASTQGRVTLAGVAATLLTALAITPLIRGLGWFVAVVVVVAVVTGSGAATRQVTSSVPVVVAVQVAAFVIGITVLFARDSAVLGLLPGPEAIAALGELRDAGLDVVRQDGPPVRATPGIILLIAGGIGLVGLVVDVIAVSLRKPAVAGLPLLLVYCVPAAVLPGGLGWFYFLLGGAGYLLLVGADAGDRIRGWGRVLGGTGQDGAGAVGGPLSGARRIGVASLAFAIILPALIPGLGERLLNQGTGDGSGEGTGSGRVTVVNPILRLRDNLTSRSDQVVITYRPGVSPPGPLRIVTDDEFTGTEWRPRSASLPRTQRVQDGFPQAPGLSDSVETELVESSYSIGDLAQTYLPLPYPTLNVQIDGTWLWDPETLNAVGEGVTTQNLEYQVDHVNVKPTREQLDSAPLPPDGVLERYTELPEDLPEQIEQIARERAGDGSNYDKALRLQNWLRSEGGFQYSEQVTRGSSGRDSGQDSVLAFLTTERSGYCVQFASAMAVMARALDIPARVAVGFLPGTRQPDDTWAISVRDAHAWPELYFQGVGWVRFEPTPATRASQAPPWAQPAPEDPTQATPTPSASASAPVPERSSLPESETATPGSTSTEEPLLGRVWAAIPWRVVGLLALALLLLGTPIAAAALARRSRWRRAGTRTARAEAAWDELRDRLADLGVGWVASWTPRALHHRLTEEYRLDGAERAALARLAGELENARYAPPDAGGLGVEELRADVRLVVSGVAAARPAGARRRARWFPSSGVSALTSTGRRVDAATDEVRRRAADRAAAVGAQIRQTLGAAGRRRRA